MPRAIHFNLIKYKEILDIIEEFDSSLRNRSESEIKEFLNNLKSIMNNSSNQILLNEEYLTGLNYDNSIFIQNNLEDSINLEREVLRPISERNIVCFKNCLQELERHNYIFAAGELIDSILDYNRSLNKTYISFSEYKLFETLIELFQNKF